jgi:class 3 adenylate cyclase
LIISHFDILGHTISIATKMSDFAKPDQIVIGQLVYDVLEDKQSTFIGFYQLIHKFGIILVTIQEVFTMYIVA